MELYIGNIPEGANDYALRRFFGMFGEPATFRVIDRDEGDGHVRYGWADIEDASRARKLIAQFNGAEMNGRTLTVRPFVHRNEANDRRAPGARRESWDGPERRFEDRRAEDDAAVENRASA